MLFTQRPITNWPDQPDSLASLYDGQDYLPTPVHWVEKDLLSGSMRWKTLSPRKQSNPISIMVTISPTSIHTSLSLQCLSIKEQLLSHWESRLPSYSLSTLDP